MFGIGRAIKRTFRRPTAGRAAQQIQPAARVEAAFDNDLEEARLFLAINDLFARFRLRKLTEMDRSPAVEADSAAAWMTHAILHRTEHDQTLSVFKHFKSEHGIILDVGSHWGYSALAIRRYGSTSPILSIEASSRHKACLDELKNWDNQYDFIIRGAGSSPDRLMLCTPVVNGSAMTGLTSVNGTTFSEHHARSLSRAVGGLVPFAPSYDVQIMFDYVDVEPIDSILDRQFRFPTGHVSAMKIDVEGHEAEALRGAIRMLSRDTPFIMIEGANRHEAVVRLLSGLGYVFAYRSGDNVYASSEISTDPDGYWMHPAKIPTYRDIGLIVDI